MPDREKVIKTLTDALTAKENYPWAKAEMSFEFIEMLLELLKEQDKEQITLHKKHVITWGRNDEFITVLDVPRTFEGLRDYLEQHEIEGIVFWKDGEPQCKIKRSDFGFKWPV